MTARPHPPVVRAGFWRHDDGTKEYGVRIQCGIRHLYIEPHNIRKLADALHDWADRHEANEPLNDSTEDKDPRP